MTAMQQPGRRRRWLIIVGILAAILLAYGLTLNWATNRLETDIQKSIRPLPTAQQAPQAHIE